jgi:hypothetical protein
MHTLRNRVAFVLVLLVLLAQGLSSCETQRSAAAAEPALRMNASTTRSEVVQGERFSVVVALFTNQPAPELRDYNVFLFPDHDAGIEATLVDQYSSYAGQTFEADFWQGPVYQNEPVTVTYTYVPLTTTPAGDLIELHYHAGDFLGNVVRQTVVLRVGIAESAPPLFYRYRQLFPIFRR